MSRGQSQTRTQSGRGTLQRCKENGRTKNVVFIDDDNDKFHNVSVDVPECAQQRFQGSKVSAPHKKLPSSSIISIDDDESSDDDNARNVDEAGGDLDDATSSKASCPASSQSQSSEESSGDECQFIWERKFPLKLSNCKWTYSGKTLSRNRFGLSPVCESSSSESNSSDCELMEGSSGKICEQWERAALRKRMSKNVRNGQSSFEDQASASGSSTDALKNVEVENTAEQHVEAPVCSSSSTANDETEKQSTSTATNDVIMGDPFKPEGGDPVADLGQTGYQENPLSCKTVSWEKAQFSHRKDGLQDRGKTSPGEPSFCDSESQSDTNVNLGGASLRNREQIPGGPSLWSSQLQSERYKKACFRDKEEKVSGEPCWFNTQSMHDMLFNRDKASFQDEEASFCNTEKLDETQVNHDRVVSLDKDDRIRQEPYFSNTQSLNDSNYERANFRHKEIPPLSNIQQDKTQINHKRSFNKDKEGPALESLCNTPQQDERSLLFHARDGDLMPDVQNHIIGDREKLKETDEYKRAAEEEWASRQRQLQIQAEEAQRLRKKKRAEALRLLDTERRQKERVEEMRETQRKDVETINLKEQLRIEVRKDLDKLEVKYYDMASLLRGLGIHVGGGLYPMSREVHAAYKQALLRFHPDRASRTDIRQQVEAEEKFKLISRLKEKLLPIS